MTSWKLATASVLALAVAGCGSATRTSAAVTGRLDCPEHQGQLTRVSASPDGKSCAYRIGDHVEVSLQLTPVVGGDADATLAALEAQLKAETQPPGPASPADTAAPKAASPAPASADKSPDKADAEKTGEWDDQAIEAKVNAKLREKGIDVTDSTGDDETARVNMPGLHITAHGDKADVRVGPIHVDANGETATIRNIQDVRMRGEAFSTRKRGIRAMFLLAGDNLGNGYKYLGYDASGPRTGPLTIAVVKSKSSGGFHGDIYGDVKRLVRRNGGT
jgi:hypothetical protein